MEWFLGSPALRMLGVAYAVLVLKMMAVGAYTSLLRIRSGVYATPEDFAFVGAPPAPPREDIERARRAHRNDLENILPFFGIGLLYAFTNPSTTAAAIYYFGFAAARIAHSIAYLAQWQPHRTIAFAVGLALMLVMTVSTLLASL